MTINNRIQKFLNSVEANYHYYLVMIICMYLYKSIRYFRSPFFSPDAENYYLPFARKLIDIGPSFIFEKNSLVISPGTYIWPALFGGNATIIRPANLILGVFMILLIVDIGRLLYSKLTGLISGFLFAISPIVIVWIPSLLSEPPFIFFTLLFIWSMIKISQKQTSYIFLCAFSLSSSILIRPVWLYPSILLLLTAPMVFFFLIEVESKIVLKNILLTIALGLVLPVSFIFHNQINYQLPALATGSGNAIFLGTNIFTGGYEPPIINLNYNVGKFFPTEFNKYDFIEFDKKLISVSKEMLKQMPIKDFFYWAVSKLSWFSFFSPLDASFKTSILRMLEFSLSLTGFIWSIREKKFAIMTLGFAYILQTGQAIPALYNIRYSAGNLEPILILLTPIGLIALFTSFQKNKKSFTFFGLFTILIFILATFAYFTLLPKIVFPKNMDYKILYENSSRTNEKLSTWTMNIPKITTDSPFNTFIKIELARDIKEFKKCSPLMFTLSESKTSLISDLTTVHSDNKNNVVIMGATTFSNTLIPESDTTLSISSEKCFITNEIRRISYVEASVSKYWLDKSVPPSL